VPLFYYLLHIPLIHASALVVSVAREGRVNPWLFENHPMMNPPPPAGYMWSLPLLYAVFAIVIALLFLPSRWYAAARAGHRHRWMRYL
jgi:formate hydrogenlyase subunit 3/multisubunit Na+/H+ antiporter MnhD subunit